MSFGLALLCGLSVAAALIAIGWWLLGKKLKLWLESTLAVRLAIAGAEVVLALAATAVANLYDLFKGATWQVPSIHTAVGCSWMALIVLCYLIVKILIALTKEKDQAKIASLGVQLGEANDKWKASISEIEILIKHRNWSARVRQLVTNIVDAKMNRLRETKRSKSSAFSETDLLEAFEPTRQIQVILTALHATIERLLEPGHEYKLRLALYLPKDGFLQPIYSFNGTTDDCFSRQSQDYMRIVEPDGAQSVMTQLYHSVEKCRIIPNCEQEEKAGKFSYLRVDQRAYIKSMVAAKKTISYPGGRDIAILTMDTNQAGFFKREEQEEVEACCNEILKRLEFELLCYHVRSTIPTLVHTPRS